jgi:hypothetical protein
MMTNGLPARPGKTMGTLARALSLVTQAGRAAVPQDGFPLF